MKANIVVKFEGEDYPFMFKIHQAIGKEGPCCEIEIISPANLIEHGTERMFNISVKDQQLFVAWSDPVCPSDVMESMLPAWCQLTAYAMKTCVSLQHLYNERLDKIEGRLTWIKDEKEKAKKKIPLQINEMRQLSAVLEHEHKVGFEIRVFDYNN